jgi:hypothetical protein
VKEIRSERKREGVQVRVKEVRLERRRIGESEGGQVREKENR